MSGMKDAKKSEKLPPPTIEEKYEALRKRYNALFADYLRTCRQIQDAGLQLQNTSRAKEAEVIQQFKPE